MNFWQYAGIEPRRHLKLGHTLPQYPPILCRLLARHKRGAPFTVQHIAEHGGLTEVEVLLISQRTDWGGIDVFTMRRFLRGCGIDFCSRTCMHRLHCYLRSNPNWAYLRRSPDWLSYYNPLLQTYSKSLA
jgi:hypothetical protein